MAVTAIDTLRYARRLKDAGVPAAQAEAMADAIGAELVEQLATKADLEVTRVAVQGDLELARLAVQGDLELARLALDGKIDTVRTGLEGKVVLLQWMLGFVLAGLVALLWRAFG